MKKSRSGFTIVELLIVIVIIAILAAITIVAYNGIQQRSQNSKIKSDLAQIQKAITLARTSRDTPLFTIFPNGAPEGPCLGAASGIDLATLSRTSHNCWVFYDGFLNAVSIASEMNIRGLTDPWGRPYYVNPNEDENTTTHVCLRDQIGTYSQPFTQSVTNVINIPLHKTSC